MLRHDAQKGVLEYTGYLDLVYAAVIGNLYIAGQYYSNGQIAAMPRQDYEQLKRGTNDNPQVAVEEAAHAPTITSHAPTSIDSGEPATEITTTGTKFTHKTQVSFNGDGDAVALTVTYVSPTSISFTVPAASIVSAQTATITILNPGKKGGTVTGNYTINA